MTEKITYEQLIEEFLKAIEQPKFDEKKEPHTWTKPEFQKEFEISSIRAGKALELLEERGVLYPKKVWRINKWEDRRPVPGYCLTDAFIPAQPELE